MKVTDVPFERTSPPPVRAPGLADFRAGGAARRAFLRYHVTDRLTGVAQVGLYHVLSVLPPAAAAAIGATLGGLVARLDWNRPYVEFMRRGMVRIRPELKGDRAGQDRLLRAWFRNAGIVRAHYPCIRKLVTPERLTVHNREIMEEAKATGKPVYLVLVHLGNWEAAGLGAGVLQLGTFFGIYEPQPNRYQNRLIYRLRRRHRLHAFPPDRHLPALLRRFACQGGENAVLFLDEVRDAENAFPLFGRPVKASSNLRFVLKLAALAEARVVPCHFVREGAGHISLRLLAHLPPPARSTNAEADATGHVLSGLFEAAIRENLEQWYMLKDMRLPPQE
ncbi:lysophospholipid acyltransferase family protein [Paroceanicella profunda]|uniref:lysophospholipid acyltransferase family protein n=1 Tax=Paroceanicella profunda TaxID=2579971 RepID=UPI001478E35C|nr:lysophospholipid acyltransferase family protein [Paroceanicella profunda]